MTEPTPKHYRLLNEGEMIREGDEWLKYNSQATFWITVTDFSPVVSGAIVRRPCLREGEEGMKTHPRKPEQFNQRLERISDHCKSGSPMMRIAPIAKLECELVLSAYYGSGAKAGWALLRQAFFLWRNDKYSAIKIWICDRVGWTKL